MRINILLTVIYQDKGMSDHCDREMPMCEGKCETDLFLRVKLPRQLQQQQQQHPLHPQHPRGRSCGLRQAGDERRQTVRPLRPWASGQHVCWQKLALIAKIHSRGIEGICMYRFLNWTCIQISIKATKAFYNKAWHTCVVMLGSCKF